MLKTIEWKDDKVIMIDQRRLPLEEVYKECLDFLDVAEAIKEMVIRGAPAIGVAAAFGTALGALHIEAKDRERFISAFDKVCDTISNTRPTARNLFWAIERMKGVLVKNPDASPVELRKLLKDEALRTYKEDIEINRQIGREGSILVEDGANILTHCNAGALATAGYGTALGVIRSAFEQGKRVHVFADETRPFLQGARLTAWEFMKEGIPATVITDNMAGYFMKKGMIDLIVVGADRIAANGDVANKIGTYSVAVLARENGIPFYVAAPFSTIDMEIKDGDGIPIEEREPSEVTHIKGIQITPDGINIKNPAFDITPNHLVEAIITERGIIRNPYLENLKR
ncbi:MAG: S-methyl-5-thioribose-1-phosphate isomerase [Thermodesulfobacteriota bacterium]